MKKIKLKGELKQNDFVEIRSDIATLGAGTGITHTHMKNCS